MGRPVIKAMELAAKWILSDQFVFGGTLSWSDQTYTFDRIVGNGSEIITDGNQIDTAPEWLGNVSFTWLPNDAFTLQVSSDYVGEYFTNPANTQSYDGHVVTNVRATYDATETIEAFVIVRNITDELYADRADFAFGNQRFFPGEPLNVTIGFKKKLN